MIDELHPKYPRTHPHRSVANDGEVVRLSPMFMDSIQRAVASAGVTLHDGMGGPAGMRPGYIFSTDEEGEKRRLKGWEDWGARQRNAWRDPSGANSGGGVSGSISPPPPVLSADGGLDNTEARKRAEQAWLARGERQRNAWREIAPLPTGITASAMLVRHAEATR